MKTKIDVELTESEQELVDLVHNILLSEVDKIVEGSDNIILKELLDRNKKLEKRINELEHRLNEVASNGGTIYQDPCNWPWTNANHWYETPWTSSPTVNTTTTTI